MMMITYMYLVLVVCFCTISGIPSNGTSMGVKGERCSDGYTTFHKSCYLLNNQVSSWIEANQMCLMFGGSLIEVDDNEEYSFIQGYLNEHGQEEGILLGAFLTRNKYNSYDSTTEYKSNPGYWMGADSIELPGHWFWIQGKHSVDFTILDSKEINVTDSSCLYFDKKNMYQARNIGCHTLMYSICEKKIPA
uniref:Perlucin-like protein isoform X1 n=1 Tax=Crassostrea virginica TaxID=6565 RepID=A0A8B8B476_CRAVI|nr:perlucin-like protein isoform X1 [Crassostrea virginica]